MHVIETVWMSESDLSLYAWMKRCEKSEANAKAAVAAAKVAFDQDEERENQQSASASTSTGSTMFKKLQRVMSTTMTIGGSGSSTTRVGVAIWVR